MKDPLPSRRELEDSGPWPEMMISNLAFPSNHRLINFMTYLYRVSSKTWTGLNNEMFKGIWLCKQ